MPMQINIQVDEPIEVVYGEKKFNVVKPKVAVVRDMQRKIKEAGKLNDGSELDVMEEFCIKAGVPKEVYDDWSQAQISSFFNQLASNGAEKKS